MSNHTWRPGDRFTFRKDTPEGNRHWPFAAPGTGILLPTDFLGVVAAVGGNCITFWHADAVNSKNLLSSQVQDILPAPWQVGDCFRIRPDVDFNDRDWHAPFADYVREKGFDHVYAVTSVHSDTVGVIESGYDTEEVFVNRSHIVPVVGPIGPTTCQCSIAVLMSVGCQCGGC